MGVDDEALVLLFLKLGCQTVILTARVLLLNAIVYGQTILVSVGA